MWFRFSLNHYPSSTSQRAVFQPSRPRVLLIFHLNAKQTKAIIAALKAKPNYPVALNNLGYAQDKLLKTEEALTLYRRTLEIEPDNQTAKRAVKKLEKRV